MPPPIRRQVSRAVADAAIVAGGADVVVEVGVHEVAIRGALYEIPALSDAESDDEEEMPLANEDAEEEGVNPANDGVAAAAAAASIPTGPVHAPATVKDLEKVERARLKALRAETRRVERDNLTRLRNQYIARSDPDLFRQKGMKYISIRGMYHRNLAGAKRKLPEGVDVPDERLWRSDGTVDVLVPEEFVPGVDFDDENASLGSLRVDAVAARPADSANMNRTQCPVNHGGQGQCTFMYVVRGGAAMKTHMRDKHFTVLGYSASEFDVKFAHWVKHGPDVCSMCPLV